MGSAGPAQPRRSRTALTNSSVCNMGPSDGVQVPGPRVVDFYAVVRRQHSTHHTHPEDAKSTRPCSRATLNTKAPEMVPNTWPCSVLRGAVGAQQEHDGSWKTDPGAGFGGVLFQGPVEVGPLNAGYHGLSGHLFFNGEGKESQCEKRRFPTTQLTCARHEM